MTKPARLHPAFAEYDPFTDQRVDSDKADDLYRYPTLPTCLHDAVARAKRLTGHMDRETLTSLALCVDRWARDGGIPNSEKLEIAESQGRDYVISSEVDCLHAWLESHPDAPPLEEWPALFGVLALRLAGSILAELWAAGAPQKANEGPYDAPQAQPSRLHQEAAIEAVRAVGVGEGLKAAVGELHRREINRRNARHSPKGKAEIQSLYIEWVGRLGESHTYRRQSHAEQDFLKWLRTEHPDLMRHVSENTARTMRRRLQAHCEKTGTPYPFNLNR